MQTKRNMSKIRFTAEENCTVGELLLKNSVSKRLIKRLKALPDGITKDGYKIRTIDSISAGESVVISTRDEKTLAPNPDLSVKILYEDNDIVVFDKPYNMPVHPSILHHTDSLGNFFAYIYPDISFRPLNRLDKDTTGACAAAKNAYSASLISKSLRKVYFAVVCGCITGNGKIELPIARLDGSIIKRAVSEFGQSAVTNYKTISHSEDGRYTLLKITLETGRTHQIRVHFSAIGYPLAGDDMYGGDLTDIRRQSLHCGEISFTSASGEKITVKSPIPKDMEKLIRN